MKNTFKEFGHGQLFSTNLKKNLASIKWVNHSEFEGVELKHIVSSDQTNGLFSFHLVKISPDKEIGLHIHENNIETHEVISGSGICINDGVNIEYSLGVISIFSANTSHKITASSSGLYLFAKFFPALC